MNHGKILFFWVLGMVLVAFLYLPSLRDGYFPVDDNTVWGAPQVQTHRLSTIPRLFIPGNQTDYYPLRDISAVVDWSWGHNLEVDAQPARIQNWIWFAGIALLLGLAMLEVSSSQVAAPLLLIWMLSPLHAELLTWLSARKDLMALFFGAGSLFFLWLALEHGSRRAAHAAWIFFGLSLLSKATFLLVPFAFLVSMILVRPEYLRTRKPLRFALVMMAASSLVLGVVLRHLYTDLNDMHFDYQPSYRILAILAGLGRMFVGLFDPRVNAVDISNWGDWLRINAGFIGPGLTVAVTFLCGIWMAWSARSKEAIVFLGVVLATYLVIPGPNFGHRNFYSTRYFEPIFLLAVFGLAWTVSQVGRRGALLLWALVLASLGLSLYDSGNWESPAAIVRKAHELHPDNPALTTLFFLEDANLLRWNRLEEPDKQEMRATWAGLRSQCDPDHATGFRNSHLCLDFWHLAPEFKPAVESLGLKFDLDPGSVRKAFLKALDVRHLSEADRQRLAPESGANFSAEEVAKTPQPPALLLPRQRIVDLFAQCQRGRTARARHMKNQYFKEGLLNDQILNQALSEVPSKMDQDLFRKCLWETRP